MAPSQFITTYTGQAVCVDGTQNNPPATNNSGQCEQLVALFAQLVLGVTLPRVVGAVNLWNNAAVLALGFTQIPASQLQPNDLVIFGASSAINSPIYGHADIVVGNITTSGYQGFDSNWQPLNLNAAGYPTAHPVNHSFVDVLGGLRYNIDTMPQAQDVTNYFKYYGFGVPTAAQITYYTTRNWQTLASDIASSLLVSLQASEKEVATLQTQVGATPTELAPGLYKV